MYVSCISGNKYLRLLSFTPNVPSAGMEGCFCGMWGWFLVGPNRILMAHPN